MKKIKYFERHELQGHMDSVEKTIFLDSSPFAVISSPRGHVFSTLQGRDAQGTFSVFRYDSNATVLLKRYDYPYSMDSDGDEGEIRGPFKGEDRYYDNIPSSLRRYAPKRVIDRVQDIRERS